MSFSENKKFDLVIIGSGISCTAVLINFLNRIVKEKLTNRPLRICIIEKEEEFWKGQPYGKRSSLNSLTITTFAEFVPTEEKNDFTQWLNINKAIWLNELRERGGATALTWIQNNEAAINTNNWEDLYIPRYLFGDYVAQKIRRTINDAEKNDCARISLITGEAIDVNKENGSFSIEINRPKGNRTLIYAQKVILAIGSPPVKNINNLGEIDNGYVYVKDAYLPSLNQNLNRLLSAFQVTHLSQNQRNILIFGTNASAIELLYLLNTIPDIRNRVNKIVMFSYSGQLPNRIIPGNKPVYEFENLLKLLNTEAFTATILIETIEVDLQIASSKGVNIGDMYYQLTDLVVELLNKLNEHERKAFHCQYGNRFSKLIRRSGEAYSDAADELERDGKLEFLKGSFLRLELLKPDNNCLQLVYSDSESRVKASSLDFPVVVNCGGFEELNFSSSPLIRNLISKKICSINCTNRGVEVNEDFEACKNFYIIGPLLGGIFNSKASLWHVENAKSIFHIANLVVQAVMTNIFFINDQKILFKKPIKNYDKVFGPAKNNRKIFYRDKKSN